MRKTSNKIVFFGSGPVAAESLRLLLKHQEVETVITKPTTLKMMAVIAKDIPVHTASSKSELDQLMDSLHLKSHLGVLIDFGIIVSKKVIEKFELGIINSHFSILPELRGADPISFAILSGEWRVESGEWVVIPCSDTGSSKLLSLAIYQLLKQVDWIQCELPALW